MEDHTEISAYIPMRIVNTDFSHVISIMPVDKIPLMRENFNFYHADGQIIHKYICISMPLDTSAMALQRKATILLASPAYINIR